MSSKTSFKLTKNLGEHNENELLSNLVDSPGHVGSSTKISVVLCITYGVLASVDCSKDDGALEKIVSCRNCGEIFHLFVTDNKRDKYFSEHMVHGEESYHTFQRVNEDSNITLSKHQDHIPGAIMVPQEKVQGDWWVLAGIKIVKYRKKVRTRRVWRALESWRS